MNRVFPRSRNRRREDLMSLFDSGAWLLLVGGVIGLVSSVIESDLNLLNSYALVTRATSSRGLVRLTQRSWRL